MHRLILLRWFLFLPFLTFAQEKITDFEGNSTQSINGTYYADTIRNKLLFFANIPEKYTNLWVSDGTKEGTRLLKDSLGESPQFYNRRPIQKYGYTYFASGSIWKTDGDKLHRIITGADSLRDFQVLANKLLVYFQYSKFVPDKPEINVSSFGWLDSLDHIKMWERDIISYQFIDHTLHYLKRNTATQNYELHKISEDGKHRVNIIAPLDTQISWFSYISKSNHDYYFFYTYQGWKFCHKPFDDEQTIHLTQWSNNDGGFDIRSFWVKDAQNNEYLLSSFNGVHIYKIAGNNEPVEQWSLPPEAFKYDADKQPYYGNIIENISIADNELRYTNAYVSEGIGAFKFNTLNLDNLHHKRSKNLLDYSSQFYYSNKLIVSRLDSNTYLLDTNYGKRAIYNFTLDSIMNISSYNYTNPSVVDTLFTVNNQKLLLTDNIYNITSGKQALITTGKIFLSYQNERFIYRALTDKLLFWKYNNVTYRTELWVSNGEKNGSSLLADIGGFFEFFFPENRMIQIDDKVYFFINVENEKGLIYETDGTKAGTKVMFEMPNSNIDYAKTSHKQGVFVTYNRDIIAVENGKVYQITNLPKSKFGFDIYVSDNQTFIITNDATAENWSYSQLFIIKDGKAVFVDDYIGYLYRYKNKAFYTKRFTTSGYNIFNLYSLNEAGKTTEIEKGIREAMIYGSKLVYQQFIETGKPPKITILDIQTNKVILTTDNFYALSIIEIGDAILLRSESKSLLSKGGKLKEITEVTMYTELITLNKGFIIKKQTNPNSSGPYIFDFKYFSIEDETIVPITTANDLIVNAQSNYVFFLRHIDNLTNGWSYWSPKASKVIELEGQRNFFNIDSVYAFSSDYNGEINCWYFDGIYLTKRYKVSYPDKIFKIGYDRYIINTLPETGSELVQLGSENLITYPEVIEGSEGIDIRSVFGFKNQLYLYGFTSTHGWQVWKMTKENPYPILSDEPTTENELAVYPNPVRDFLNVRADKVFSYRVINIKGQELMKGKLGNEELMDLKSIPTGVYIIQFFDGNKIYSKKVIKN